MPLARGSATLSICGRRAQHALVPWDLGILPSRMWLQKATQTAWLLNTWTNQSFPFPGLVPKDDGAIQLPMSAGKHAPDKMLEQLLRGAVGLA